MNDANQKPGGGQHHSSAPATEALALDAIEAWVAADPRRRVWTEDGAIHAIDEFGQGATIANLARATTRRPWGLPPEKGEVLS